MRNDCSIFGCLQKKKEENLEEMTRCTKSPQLAYCLSTLPCECVANLYAYLTSVMDKRGLHFDF